MKVIEPATEVDFRKYFKVRWEVLRKPWGHPEGSEKDEMENECIHAMAIDDENNCIAVGRLQFNDSAVAQIRYMGVMESARGKDVGTKIIKYLENRAKNNGVKKIILHARENAVAFYKKEGFVIIEESYLLWEEIQHYLMEKSFVEKID